MRNPTSYNERQRLAQETTMKQGLLRILRGMEAVGKDWRKLVAVLLMAASFAAVWAWRHPIFSYTPGGPFAPLNDTLLALALGTLFLLILVILWTIWGGPLTARIVQDNLARAGLLNHAGEAPTLLSVDKDSTNPRVRIYTFHMCGWSLTEWKDYIPKIQAALNVTVADIRIDYHYQRVSLYAVPGSCRLPDKLVWKDEYKQDRYIVVGESLMGMEKYSLDDMPHTLIAGASGSGKTVLMRLILWQLVLMGEQVYIIDFKGGMDYADERWDDCPKVYTMDDLLELLEQVMAEMERRQDLFRKNKARDLAAYRRKTGERLQAIILGCDELAEILDKAGRDKEEKAKIAKVESMLTSCCRLGRAVGIHVIGSLQRPSVDVLSGGIRNNMDARLLGRCEPVLAEMVLNDSAAADVIPPDAKGRFVNQHGVLIQVYLLED